MSVMLAHFVACRNSGTKRKEAKDGKLRSKYGEILGIRQYFVGVTVSCQNINSLRDRWFSLFSLFTCTLGAAAGQTTLLDLPQSLTFACQVRWISQESIVAKILWNYGCPYTVCLYVFSGLTLEAKGHELMNPLFFCA